MSIHILYMWIVNTHFHDHHHQHTTALCPSFSRFGNQISSLSTLNLKCVGDIIESHLNCFFFGSSWLLLGESVCIFSESSLFSRSANHFNLAKFSNSFQMMNNVRRLKRKSEKTGLTVAYISWFLSEVIMVGRREDWMNERTCTLFFWRPAHSCKRVKLNSMAITRWNWGGWNFMAQFWMEKTLNSAIRLSWVAHSSLVSLCSALSGGDDMMIKWPATNNRRKHVNPLTP